MPDGPSRRGTDHTRNRAEPMSSAESQTTVESGKPTLQMDRLLDVVVKQDASDLHLSCGRPPTIRLSGRLRNLATKTLEPEDMMQLMKSVTPEKNQQELQEKGSTSRRSART